MLTQLTQAQLVDGAVLLCTLGGELGPERPITMLRPIPPLVVAVGIVLLYVRSIATQGMGVTVELAGIAAGLVGGLAALGLVHVFHSERTGGPASHAGWPYALVWFAVFGARAWFSYGCVHLFPLQYAQWRATHRVASDTITDALVFMADAMIVTCCLGVVARAAALPKPVSEPRLVGSDVDP
ncbi:hypothetical protein [Catenulispora pinisilvae]|uniref:hypothetical protein n=1 Tax=Catenulispora pinisilvae TaxID=2705253 RepID=UPI001891E171|nr:hypothetical protein [Catenulispora pinisilvae]